MCGFVCRRNSWGARGCFALWVGQNNFYFFKLQDNICFIHITEASSKHKQNCYKVHQLTCSETFGCIFVLSSTDLV